MADLTKQQDLEEMCRYWQRRLGLQDWKIRVELAHEAWQTDHCFGFVKPMSTEKRALVFVGDEAVHHEVKPAHGQTTAVEETLIHELLEIKLWWLQPVIDGDPMRTLKEQTINAIAEALYSLAQGANRDPSSA